MLAFSCSSSTPCLYLSISSEKGAWIGVNLDEPTAVCGVMTQGKPNSEAQVVTCKIAYRKDYPPHLVYLTDESGKAKVKTNRDLLMLEQTNRPCPYFIHSGRIFKSVNSTLSLTYQGHLSTTKNPL